jgi:cytoskeleton protein RodZ
MMDQTVGTTLRQKREEKKISLEQVFQDTRIRLSYLQAIESDQLDQIPSRAQAHGFIRLYANYLGVDSYSLLDLLNPPIPQKEENVPIEPVVNSTTKAIEDRKKVLEDLVQKSKATLGDKITVALHRIRENFIQINEKIPYEVVKKSKQPVTPSTDESSTPQLLPVKPTGGQKSYQVMCKAIGASLRQKRESLGLSLADVERQTRIREIFLYAIEEGNLDDLPSTVQGRGMLGNYAVFMGLDSEAFLSRFAEALQQKRLETLPEEKTGVPLPTSNPQQSLTGWRRLISPDLIFTGGLFLVFFVFIIWGAVQLMSINKPTVSPTVIPISDLLLGSGTPQSSDMVTVEGSTPQQITPTSTPGFGAGEDLQGTLSATQTGAIQLVIVAHHRAYMKITIDGKDAYVGLVVPGTIYSYSGDSIITLLTGDGSALEVYYNQNDLGILGITGQVVDMQFTDKGSTDLGALNTATPAPTILPSLTPRPTEIPTITPVVISPTLATTSITPTITGTY